MRGGDGEGRDGLPVTGRLRAPAGRPGRAAAFPVREAVEPCQGDMEDLRAAEEAAAESRKSGGRTVPLDDPDGHPGPEDRNRRPRDRKNLNT